MTRNWKYKVVKQMRGMQGEWFDYPTSATFTDLETARAYAENFARQQGLAGVSGARIEVRSRRKYISELGTPLYCVEEFKSDDYLRK